MSYESAFYFVPILCLFLFSFVNISFGKALACWAIYSVVDLALNTQYKFVDIQKVIFSQYDASGKLLSATEIMSHDTLVLQSLSFTLLCFCLTLFCKWYSSKFVLFWLCIINSGVMVINAISSSEAHGLLYNPAMDATVVAITAPYIMTWAYHTNGDEKDLPAWKYLAFLVPGIAIFLTHSSVGLAGFGISLATYFTAKYKKFYYLLIPVLISIVAMIVLPIGYLLHDGGRFAQYRASMDWWFTSGHTLTGTGLGTYGVFGPYIQYLNGHRSNEGWFLFMHNEWLQIPFELGYIGYTLACLVFMKMIKKSLKDYSLLAAVLTIGATSTFQWTLRHPISLLVCIMIWFLTEEQKHEDKCK